MIKKHRRENPQMMAHAYNNYKENADHNKLLSETQHTALAIVASMRHELHRTKDTNQQNILEERKKALISSST